MPTVNKQTKVLIWLLAPTIGFLGTFLVSSIDQGGEPATSQVNTPVLEPVMRLEAVAALGRLSPSGEIRSLAAPLSGFGGTPRVAELLINEGELVEEGQVLAVFDNRPSVVADLAVVSARLKTLAIKIRMQKREVSRYQEAADQGAASLVLLEEKQDELVKFLGQEEEALAQLKGLEVDLANSQLKSPINGVVLRVHAREGERPGAQGVVEVGDNQNMEALIEVYESDVSRIELGQSVTLISENGGFDGTLRGKVQRISPQVRQRKVLSTDPTGDADARVVEVRVILEPTSSKQVRELTGMKVIARFLVE